MLGGIGATDTAHWLLQGWTISKPYVCEREQGQEIFAGDQSAGIFTSGFMNQLTKPQIDAIFKMKADGMSARGIGKKLHLNPSTVCRYLNGEKKFSPLPTPIDPAEVERRATQEKADREQYKTAVKEVAFRQFIEDAIATNVQPCLKVQKPEHRKVNKSAFKRYPLLPFNDWHFEERVNAEGVHGLNSYDIPTACRRLWRVVHACIDWKRNIEAGGRFTVPSLVVAGLGDLLTGTLHGLERHGDAPNIVRSVLACGDLLALAIADLAAEFPQIIFTGVVGNHGRLPDDKKVPTKDPTRSWDHLAYAIARRRLSNAKNIQWHMPESYGMLFEVGGHLCYGAHGNFIPNNLGVIGYGVRRFTTSIASNLQAAGKPLKYCFFGHWHSSNAAEFSGVESYICPSLIGTQEYSFLSGGSVNRPAQEMHIFDEQLGRIGSEKLYGEGHGYDGTYELSI